jgi:hypothetical protein
MKVPKVFFADRRSAGAAGNAAVAHHARSMLHRIARDLRLRAGQHEIVSEPPCRSRGNRVSLRTDSLMLEVTNTPVHRPVAVCFRTRRGRNDFGGGRDNDVDLNQLASGEGYDALLDGLRLTGGLDIKR